MAVFFIYKVKYLTIHRNVDRIKKKKKERGGSMKKIIFAAHSLDIGGIEKALVTLTNYLQKKGYEVTIVLEKKQGIFLKEINPNITIIEYKPDESKNIILRKAKNLIKRIQFIGKYKNKYDFSASFATYSISSSFVSRVASKNNCLWGHADYLTLFNNQEQEMKKFFKERKYHKFKHIVFVSQEGKESFIKVFPEMKQKTIVCNNLIDGKKIKKLAEEEIETKKEKTTTTFLNVGRHDEKQKKLTRIIEAAKQLKEEGYPFKILLVGDGPDSKTYQKKVEENNLQENILFLGKKQNPYPYFKIADCVLLSSEYEGYPVVFLESFTLNKPLITTKVSDYKQVEGKYGYVTEKNTEEIYQKMKLFLKKGFTIQKKFDDKEYNEKIIKKLEELF